MLWKLTLFCVVFGIGVISAQKCDDIDTNACKLLQAQKPDLCSDPTTAQSVCPRFCKLCPVECYHCNVTVMDYHECNTTMLCGEGQVCMKKELKSFIDGHHEYEMTCEQRELCDGGAGFSIPFGKRDIATRDISVKCCAEDLCNYPEVPTTVPPVVVQGCPKDIVFLVDESSRVLASEHDAAKNAIIEVVKQLSIGQSAYKVALYGYDTQVHTKVNFQQYSDKAELISAIQSHTLAQNSNHFFRGDTSDAIKFLADTALTKPSGDRSSYPDAIVIIGDVATSSNVRLSIVDRLRLNQLSHDVIVVSVGRSTTSTLPLDQVATDRNHILHLHDLYNSQLFVDKILPLLLKC